MTARAAPGFTLIETLVALVVLSIVLSPVYAIMGGGLRQAKRDEDRLLLAMVAENLLARARLDLYPARGAITGEIAGGVRWSIDSVPYRVPLPPGLADGDRREDAATDRGGAFGQGGGSSFGSGGGGSSSFGGGGSSSGNGGSSFGSGGGSSFGSGGSSFGSGGDQGGSSFGRSGGGSSFGTGDDRGGFGGGDSSSGSGLGEGSGFGQDGESGGGRDSDTASGPGSRDESRQSQRRPLQLRVLQVVVQRGEERFALESLVPVPQERERGLPTQP